MNSAGAPLCGFYIDSSYPKSSISDFVANVFSRNFKPDSLF